MPDTHVAKSVEEFDFALTLYRPETLVFSMMAMLELLTCLDPHAPADAVRETNLKARAILGELLGRWVPDDVAGAAAGFMLAEGLPVFPTEAEINEAHALADELATSGRWN
jgi:hypothetical protein